MSMVELLSGERQVAPTLDGIRADHRARYSWVTRRGHQHMIDAGCGVGYGSQVLADGGAEVFAFDASDEAIGFAQEHYNHNPYINFVREDVYTVDLPEAEAVCAFEVLEHLANPDVALRRWSGVANRLYVSVPNEDVLPYKGKYLHHMRHYTKEELTELLLANGWRPTEWWGQEDTQSDVVRDVNGRTLIAVCDRLATLPVVEAVPPDEELERHLLNGKQPKSVAIVAMGTSALDWMSITSAHGGRWGVADEVWVVNNLGGVLAHDRVFHMDDLAIQESRVEAKESSALAGMLLWLPHHPHVYSTRAYKERYPGVREYPLEWVLNRVNVSPYFSGTLSYMVPFALALGSVTDLHVYGADFHYENPILRERGRACVEFWLGVAEAKGVKVHVPAKTTLYDSRWGGRQELYGYDTEWVRVEHTDRFRVSRTPRKPEDIPSAEAMAARYSHNPQTDGR